MFSVQGRVEGLGVRVVGLGLGVRVWGSIEVLGARVSRGPGTKGRCFRVQC